VEALREAAALPYLTTPIDCGVDWLTATCKAGNGADSFEDIGETILHKQRAAGVEVKPAALRDYAGRRGEGCYVGRRADDSIIVLSGQRAAHHWKEVTAGSTNVSRLDLQVTIWTHGEQPRLALHTYRKLSRLPPSRGRRPTLTYIERKPAGETLNIGSRSSDCYGRLYDKASEANVGPARTLWRYEVEYKREGARNLSRALSSSVNPRCYIEACIHDWWLRRGVRPSWELSGDFHTENSLSCSKERDVLSWFRASVSKTVARAINRYGMDAVLDALNLTDFVQPIGGDSDAG
jgi:hypothetical protein